MHSCTEPINLGRFCRNTFCAITNMLLNGMDISSVSAISGHKTWSQLKKYTRIKATDLVGPVNSVMLRIKG